MMDTQLLQTIREEIESLRVLIDNGTIRAPELEVIDRMRKDKIKTYVNRVHKYSIGTNSRGFYCTRNPLKPDYKITSKTEYGLYEKLYELYTTEAASACDRRYMLDNLFEEYMAWAEFTQYRVKKTLKEKRGHWERQFVMSDISDKDIRDITLADIMAVYSKITAGRVMTRKYFSEIQGVLHDVYKYAISILGLNITDLPKMADVSMLSFKDCHSATDEIAALPLTKEQIDLVDKFCMQDIHDMQRLMIRLNLRLGLRYAELAALRWQDVSLEERIVHVRGQIDSQHERVEYTKKHTKEGQRDIPLTKSAEKVFRLIMFCSGSDRKPEDLIFHADGYEAFYRRCKRAFAYALGCESVDDLPNHYVTHTLRATTATILYNEGVPPKVIQKLMGHTTLSMTMRYCRDFTDQEEVRDYLTAALG